MNKKVLFAATMAAVLASCSSDDLSVQTAAKQEAQGLENAVSFEAYSQRSLTRAGAVGAMDNDKLKTEGFGVFGYYTDMNEYDQTSTPNFMYNQKVSGAGWTYEPVKYWPNEYGNKAISDDVDKLTFFAYAPYTANTPATGKVNGDQVGITGFTRNTAAGDPYVKYIASLDPSKCVDLCWGVADPNQDVTWDIINGGSQKMSAGMPWLNVQRPQKSLGQKMKFVFKHALSQLNVQIDADVNTNKHDKGAELDANTKVFVRSVTFNGFAMKGALNLNNEEANTPNWKGYNCSNEPLQSEEYTIYDGMKDGKEGTGYTASNEKVTGLNEKIIQDKAWNQSAEGVTKTAKNLFKGAVNDPIYVIPTGDDMSITIVYDIETKDANLAGTVSDLETAGVSIENKITKTITVTGSTPAGALKLEAGKKYTIQLHLGLSQVEFDAEVSEWQTSDAGEAWLPGNGAGDVYTTGITLAPTSLDMTVFDADVTLTANVTPDNATDQTVTWTSSDESVATVDANGKVHAVAAGTATITAIASGGQTATCTVAVTFNLSALKTWVNDGHASDNTYLGWYVDGEGNISETDGGSSVGRIAYYGIDDVETADGTQNILVIATANATSSSVAWKTAGDAGESAYNSTTAMNGKAFTDQYGSDAGYPAAKAAKDYSAAAPSGSTGWFLPSYAQWQKMDAAIIAKGLIPSEYYWSSTESEVYDFDAWSYSFNGTYSSMYDGSKADPFPRVRPVLAY